jgi:hypothetical protein
MQLATADPIAPSIIREITAGDALDFCAVGRLLDTHTSTVHRWAFRGLPAGPGRRVRLEAVRRGSKWLTSRAAVERFLGKLPRSVSDDDAVPTPRSPAKRQSADEAAAAELQRRGI